MENKTSRGLKVKYANVILGLVFMLFAAVVLYICNKDNMSFYLNNAPGPGFMPMISAGIVGLCGLGILIRSVLKLKEETEEGEKILATLTEWQCFIAVIAVCSATVLVADYIGLITAITLAIILLIRFLGPEPWKTAVIVGLGTGIVIYLIFIVLLSVHVPTGPFGF